MSRFTSRIRPYLQQEWRAAAQAEQNGQPDLAFNHLERAHVLGQASTRGHCAAHWYMLCWAFRQRDWWEGLGQMLRLLAALTKTPLGWLPTGNTGGSRISPFKVLPIPFELAEILRKTQQG